MPSRQPSPPIPPSQPSISRPHHLSPLLFPLTASLTVLLLVLLLILFLYRKFSRPRTAPSPLLPPHHPHSFPYSVLRRSTSSFSPSLKLGQGGFGSVFRASLPPSSFPAAVKLMDSGSLQGEREFHNELSLAPIINGSDRIVSLLGFCSHPRPRRLLLVYELMPNGSLQDALLDRRCPELMSWSRRFSVAVDIARGLEFLHAVCDPPVIHGDIKPSNVLLDCDFHAKIADFGLARLKTDSCSSVVEIEPAAKADGPGKGKKRREEMEEAGSAIEEPESIMTATAGFEDAVNGNAGFVVAVDASPEASPETVFGVDASNSEILDKTSLDKTSVSEGCFDKLSVDSGKEMGGARSVGGQPRKKGVAGKDWWWRQDNAGSSEAGGVKDYVMEWIGTEIKKERPKSDWIAASTAENGKLVGKTERKKQQRRLEWWASLDEDRAPKKEKSRPAREWWREEFCEELSKKKKKKRISESSGGGADGGEQWWQRDDEADPPVKKKKKNRSRSSRSSMDWWMDGLSGEFRFGRRNSLDWMSGEIPKSGGVSSTPSMRGTVCYVAPEYGGGGPLSEKCDVYSFGVLLLVLVSGRRPLQVTASPMSEFERANLISWARHLARTGKLLDLVDPDLQNLDQDQALMCITVALLCLQRSPSQRPNVKEVAAMLSGESEAPHLPVEFSPSPPSGFPFRSRKKAR
ncbi:receptor-like serine/threonine-protein kinase At2g45590 [Magnolia sinica]|uniref:receptor-like serine/threonine-protein kinase At2g45590 n=1 Tax=Magnolia sinica TaxID=86752 RepID=UPI0026589BBA|nr:receptor-like serine/threonine-protein kinase At2g45590 [Magnolia sinica]